MLTSRTGSVIGQTISHFRITARIGEGGMGEVYRATDTRLSREVAVKVLPDAFAQDAERLARFEREARVLAALSHPNIASIYGLEQDDSRSYLILELAEGESLSERLTTGPMPVPDALAAGLQIAQALEAAHEKGIIHRDLKPANIKIAPGGQVKVLDFGLAKALEEQQARPEVSLTHSPTVTGKMTTPGVLLGTAAYMSPEQVRGQAADRRSDVWAFGLVLYEMLSGNQAFAEPTLSDTLASVLRSEIDWRKLPPETPSSIRRLLRRCLERDVKRRLPDIGAARLELQESLEGRADDAAPATAGAAAAPARSSRLPWAVAGAAILAAAGLATLWMRGRTETTVVRASLSPSPGVAFDLPSAGPGTPVLSPDGRRLAFTAVDAEGNSLLYVRALDAAYAEPLKGTEGAAYPFWSPDGSRLGFFTGAKLKTVEARGGSPVTVCDAPNGKGGAWSEAGEIFFAASHVGPLKRVPAAGGEPKPWGKLDEKRGDVSHRHPRLLPGGRHLMYVVIGKDESVEDHAIVAAPLDGGPEKAIVRSPAAAEYADGHLFYLRGRTLHAQPFDARKLAFTGEPSYVAEGVNLISLASAAAVFTVSRGGTIVYRVAGDTDRAVLTWVDPTGRSLGTIGTPGDFRTAAVSPDGRYVVASLRVPPSRTRDLWLYDVARNLSTRFTFDPGEESFPLWSVDGRSIFYTADGRKAGDIYRKGIDGTEPVRVSESDGDQVALAITQDGRFLATTRNDPKTSWDVWVVPLAGGEPRAFVAGPKLDLAAAFSPDGRWLAYVSDESGTVQMYVTSFPQPGRKWQVTSGSAVYAIWSRDGRSILYQRGNGELRRVAVDVRGDEVVIGAEAALFVTTSPSPAFRGFAASADLTKLLQLRPENRADPLLSLVVNWKPPRSSETR